MENISIEQLREKGIPVKMKDGSIVEYCQDTSQAGSLILDLEDFPEIRTG